MLTNWFKVAALGQIDSRGERERVRGRERERRDGDTAERLISALAGFIARPHDVAIV